MSRTHMIINTLRFRKRLQAHPANMRLTLSASHMIASRNFLDGRLATRTALDIMRLHPLLEKFLAFNVTIRT